VLVAVALLIAQRAGLFAHVSRPKQLAESLVALGFWGWAAFIVAYALFQPFGVPGTVFIVAAPLIWPWKLAFLLSLIGTMCASVIGFSFARFVARDWVSSRVPERFRKYDSAMEREGFRTVFVLRLLFWMPQVLHWFFGLSKVSFWKHFFGSLFGYIPPLLVVSYFGTRVFDLEGNLKPGAFRILALFFAGSLALALGIREVERRRSRV
jgi:uncharacterized membrane protein YdjX (TVP38/TMEM64 family)